jgi:hypothetical protein
MFRYGIHVLAAPAFDVIDAGTEREALTIARDVYGPSVAVYQIGGAY